MNKKIALTATCLLYTAMRTKSRSENQELATVKLRAIVIKHSKGEVSFLNENFTRLSLSGRSKRSLGKRHCLDHTPTTLNTRCNVCVASALRNTRTTPLALPPKPTCSTLTHTSEDIVFVAPICLTRPYSLGEYHYGCA